MTTFACTITGPYGVLNLEMPDGGTYELEKTTASEREVTWRKIEVEDEHVDDTFVIAAVKSKVIETVAVWVTADTQGVLRAAVKFLTESFDQLQYVMTWGVDGVLEQWKCSPAQYTVRTQHEYLHAHTALVTARVPRSPKVIEL